MESEVIPAVERRVAGWVARRIWMGDRSGKPWDPPEGLSWEPVRFRGNTGSRLVGRYFYRDDPRGVVVCVHPDRRYAGHWFVKVGWVDGLLDAGYDVLIFDLTAYGGSEGPATYYAEDVREAVRFARRWSAGLPTHVFGVSMGAYAAAIASPWLDNVESLILESPYPSFVDWYGAGLGALGARAFNLLFPRTGRFLQAGERIRRAAPRRILVTAATDDEVTPAALSRRVAEAAPAGRTRYLEVPEVPHLGLHADETYRRAVLATIEDRESPAVRTPATNGFQGGRVTVRPARQGARRSRS